MKMTTILDWGNETTLLTNGNSKFAENGKKDTTTTRIWTKLRMNESTVSLTFLTLSISMVLWKFCINYGKLMPWQISNRHSMPSVTQMYDTIPSMSVLSKVDVKQLSADRFLNVSGQYAETAADTLVSVYGQYNWLLKATMSGLVITSFSWFILYKDSSIPGVNPPSPFSPSRQRLRERSRIQINYFVGMLNGILFFIYMCL